MAKVINKKYGDVYRCNIWSNIRVHCGVVNIDSYCDIRIGSGQQISTFYPIIGIALGFNNTVNSAYLGFSLPIIRAL